MADDGSTHLGRLLDSFCELLRLSFFPRRVSCLVCSLPPGRVEASGRGLVVPSIPPIGRGPATARFVILRADKHLIVSPSLARLEALRHRLPDTGDDVAEI